MKWVLVYIMITDVGNAYAINAFTPKHSFDTLDDCYKARMELALKIGDYLLFPPGKEAVCVRIKK